MRRTNWGLDFRLFFFFLIHLQYTSDDKEFALVVFIAKKKKNSSSSSIIRQFLFSIKNFLNFFGDEIRVRKRWFN